MLRLLLIMALLVAVPFADDDYFDNVSTVEEQESDFFDHSSTPASVRETESPSSENSGDYFSNGGTEDDLWNSLLSDVVGDGFEEVDRREYSGDDSIHTSEDSGYRPGNAAYIHNSLVSVVEGTIAEVLEDQTNVRLGPSTEFQVMAVASRGHQFRYVSRIGDWVEIALDLDALEGLVEQEEDQPAPVESPMWGTVRVNTRLNFRSAPWGRIIGKFENGDRVQILSQQADWYRIRGNGQTGYVHSRYVETGDQIQPAPQIEPDPGETVVESRPIESTEGRVVRRNSGVEIEGVMVQSQNQTDPFDPNGGRGSRPSGYCGPTSLQNVMAFYGVERSRDYLALTDVGAGPMYRRGVGSAYAPMVEMCRHLGFSGTEQVWNADINDIRERVEAGRPQIVSVQGTIRDVDGRGYHTNGHIMVVVGVKDNGNVIVHDSAGSGARRELPRSNFMQIWREFLIDVKQ